MKNFPRPTGQLQGDTKAMPNRGTGTGFSGHDTMLDGASTDASAINRKKGISGATKSDSAEDNMPPGGSHD